MTEYRPPARDGVPWLPFWEVTWYEGEHRRNRAELLTSEKAAVTYAQGLAQEKTNSLVKAVRVDWFDVQVYPEESSELDVVMMSREALEREVFWLRRLNKDLGKHIKTQINGSRMR